MKRTTLILEDGCMNRIREIAHAEERTISDVVNELLIEGIQRRRRRPRARGFELPSFSMGAPRVNLGDRNALEASIDS
jgi:hypothetical protein